MKFEFLNLCSDPTREILRMLASVSEKLNDPGFQSTEFLSAREKKEHRIDLIHATMQLDNISLSREKTALILERKTVRGLQHRIKQIQNISKVYDRLATFDPMSKDSLLSSHAMLMDGWPVLAGWQEEEEEERQEVAGCFRTIEIPVMRELKFLGFSPPHEEVPGAMNTLFKFLNRSKEDLIIKSCMALFILEWVRPFEHGNGMIGRLWQKLLLIQKNPAFEYLPLEARIHQSSSEYFRVLTLSEENEDPAEFILFILQMIDDLLIDLVHPPKIIKSASDRLYYFCKLGYRTFTRKDYMSVFKNISSATASRDLFKGTEAGLIERRGTKNITVYSCQNLSELINTYGR